MAHAPILHVHVKEAAQDTCQVFVEGSEADTATVHFACDDALKQQVEVLHDRGDQRLMTIPDQEPVCQTLGEFLFTTFFTQPMLQHYRAYREKFAAPRIALHLPRKLYWLPWELLRDPTELPGRFLSVYGSIVRFDEEVTGPKNPIFQPVEGRLRFLFLLSSPIDRPLGEFEPSGSYEPAFGFVPVKPATYDLFTASMSDTKPFGWIFFGHGEVEHSMGRLVFVKKEARRLFSNLVADPKPSYSIGDAIGDAKWIRMASLFACESAWAKDAVTFDRSVAGAILNRTFIAYVIAAQTPLDTPAAREYLDALFQALIDGLPLDLATGKARKTVKDIDSALKTMRFSALDWWVPVLYSRTTSFDILPPKQPVPLPEIIERGAAIPIQVPSSIPRDRFAETKAMIQAVVSLFKADESPLDDRKI